MNFFKIATRQAFRFASPVGDLTVEQLWNLPLTTVSPNKASLNDCAVRLSRDLKALGEESFVASTSTPAKTLIEVKLEVVKAIIADRQAENTAATERAAAASKRAKIDEIIASKQDKQLEEMSLEELEAMKTNL